MSHISLIVFGSAGQFPSTYGSQGFSMCGDTNFLDKSIIELVLFNVFVSISGLISRFHIACFFSSNWLCIYHHDQIREMENTKTQLENTLQSRSAELSQAQAQVHTLELELVSLYLSCFCVSIAQDFLFLFKLQVHYFSIHIYRQCNSFRCTFTKTIHSNWIFSNFL